MQKEIKQQQLTTDEKNDFIFRTLSNMSNRTEDFITGLMEKAHIAPKPSSDTCRKMAVKFLWILWNSERLSGKGKGWVPTQSCVDLTTTGAALTAEEEEMSLDEVRALWETDANKIKTKTSRRVMRHFKNCLQCGRRFLPKRKDAEFHNEKCQQRYRRANPKPVPAPLTAITAQAPLEAL